MGTERERSAILCDLRRELSTVGAKAVSSCLLGRVARVGEGVTVVNPLQRRMIDQAAVAAGHSLSQIQ